ncbi:allophanate hydrolase [Burkholderia sp. Leaf177]|uniref:allophanate hydrolase n=1 Tax=Burkholderia sp. Leaf177 TaxID=1736287 RepID=UPI0006FCA690|nr:allophanate hydrolase [Burkholderia sp. Leaf177]KQR74266.1 allophanate hydrolase [Burkholderia sp. Leaf177]
MDNDPRTFDCLRVTKLLDAYRLRDFTPVSVIDMVFDRIGEIDRPEIWTLLLPVDAVRAQARALEKALAEEGDTVFERLPLFGVPFAVKDNIDVAGLPTTAACEPFSYTPEFSAFAIQRLLDAGAILVGKTNLDQFATGLVGTRSPFGAVRQVEFPERVSGGSSSGSAVSVAAGCVAFSLGTDTAGSGRVPAGFNGIVGLKPSLGLVSKRGVVPACRSLDTLSIFAHDVADAWHVLAQMAKFDARDAYSRKVPPLGATSSALRLGVPAELEFFNDTTAQQAFGATLDVISADLATTPDAIDFTPFKRVSALLYDGPWVAERRAALGAFFDTNFADIDTTVAAVIGKADRFSAVDAFNGQYALAELKRESERCFDGIDVLIVPTTPTHPLIADVQASPIERNSELGYYTNFVNLLDLCALSVPCARRSDGLPAGVTLIAPSGSDHRLAVLGARIQALFNDTASPELQPLPFQEPTVALAVVGAHLRGQPLNKQLLEAGAQFMEATSTSSAYQLFALPNTSPPKPGLVRNADRIGAAIAVEVWDVPVRSFGKFVMDVPSPMGIGTIELSDGRFVKGFICEPWAVSEMSGARDITAFGGWIAYLDSLQTRT